MQQALNIAPPDLAAELADAQQLLADFLGVGYADRMLFTPGCTSALQLAIAELPWQEGDRIVTSTLEHHALIRPVQQLARRGIEHVLAPRTGVAPLDLDFLERTLRIGKVRLVAISAAANVTGEVLPVADAAALAHRYGALLLADGAQSAGVVAPDLATAGADIVTFAGHKALLGPQGIGGLWAAPHVQFDCPTAVCDIAASGDSSPSIARANFPGYCDVGSVNMMAVFGLTAGVKWLLANPEAGSNAMHLASQLRVGLQQRGDYTVFGGAAPGTGAVSLLLAGRAPDAVEAFLAARGIVTRAGQHCAPLAIAAIGASDAGTLRVAFGAFNTEQDVARVLNELDACAGQ